MKKRLAKKSGKVVDKLTKMHEDYGKYVSKSKPWSRMSEKERDEYNKKTFSLLNARASETLHRGK